MGRGANGAVQRCELHPNVSGWHAGGNALRFKRAGAREAPQEGGRHVHMSRRNAAVLRAECPSLACSSWKHCTGSGLARPRALPTCIMGGRHAGSFL